MDSDKDLIVDESVETAQYFKGKFGPFTAAIVSSRNPVRCDICGGKVAHSEPYVRAASQKDPSKPPLSICLDGVCGKALYGEKKWNGILFKAVSGTVEYSRDPDILREEIAAEVAVKTKVDAISAKLIEDSHLATAISLVHLSDGKDAGFSMEIIRGILKNYKDGKPLTAKQLSTLQGYNRACKRESFMETL